MDINEEKKMLMSEKNRSNIKKDFLNSESVHECTQIAYMVLHYVFQAGGLGAPCKQWLRHRAPRSPPPGLSAKNWLVGQWRRGHCRQSRFAGRPGRPAAAVEPW